MPCRPVKKRDWWRVAAAILLTLGVIGVSAAVLVPLARPIGFIIWLVVFAGGGLLLLVKWHAEKTAYRCAACGETFEIGTLTDLVSLQYPNKKYLKCPHCGRWSWATVLMKED